MILAQELIQIPRFSGLKTTTLKWLSERVHRVKIPKSNFVFSEDDSCDALYIIESGSIKVFKSLESGRELTIDIFYHGDALGEVALIDEGIYPASAVALEDSSILKLPKDDYLKLLSFSDATSSVIRDLSLRMRALNRRVRELGSGEVEQRLALVVLTISQRSQPQKNSDLLICDLTRQELSSLVGARMETVIRIISKWHKSGIAVKSPNGLQVKKSGIAKLLEDKNKDLDL
jgi:CRP/FNR family transcriptional regulator